MKFFFKRFFVSAVILLILSGFAFSETSQITKDNIRIQLLSPTLIRFEEKGPMGFVDDKTFLVVDRNWKEIKFTQEEKDGKTIIKTDYYKIIVPENTSTLKNIEIFSSKNEKLFSFEEKYPDISLFPAPSEIGKVYVLPDKPRVIPPAWGATPMPEDAKTDFPETSGWNLSNNANDIYVFIVGKDGYDGLKKDFLKLTGPVPLPPLFVLGFWNSRYHPYSHEEAISTIERYRKEGIPLDVFVVDSDWRVGGSGGYDIETKLFPDMKKFLEDAHSRNVKIMFNDHPQPNGMKPLEPKMLKFRYDNLTKFLGMGLDFWWFDRNWQDIISGPIDGIDTEVWGQKLYFDAHSTFHPEERPLIMSMRSIHPASHRFPIWWTGDIYSTFSSLREGVEDSVRDGIQFMPWVNQDLGGHTGNPSRELYVRFLEWGCLSPVTRVHCTSGEKIRYPWAFGELAQKIATDYIKLRYRLIPYLYTAARKSYDDGTPILRRCDLYWPQFDEAKSNLQYLLSDNILIKPVTSEIGSYIRKDKLHNVDGKPGLKAEYFNNADLSGTPIIIKNDEEIYFNWNGQSPHKKVNKENFSVRWIGTIGPIEKDGDYKIYTLADDGVRLWFDGKQMIDDWRSHVPKENSFTVRLEKGKSYPVKMEYFQGNGGAEVYLCWELPYNDTKKILTALWIPPGEWEDAWTGEIISGPKKIQVESELWHTPMYFKRGSIIPLAPDMQYTSEKPWNPITCEVFVPKKGKAESELYEDDGKTIAYQKGEFRKTSFKLDRNGKNISFTIGKAIGDFKGSTKLKIWFVRFHLYPNEEVKQVKVNGETIEKFGKHFVPIHDMTSTLIQILKPEKTESKRNEIPLQSIRSLPKPKAGDIVEIFLHAEDVMKEQKIKIELK